jgi:hypothetical protein
MIDVLIAFLVLGALVWAGKKYAPVEWFWYIVGGAGAVAILVALAKLGVI